MYSIEVLNVYVFKWSITCIYYMHIFNWKTKYTYFLHVFVIEILGVSVHHIFNLNIRCMYRTMYLIEKLDVCIILYI